MLISAVQQTYSDIWNSPGTNTRLGSLSLIQGIFLIQGLNLGLLHSRQILFHLSHQDAHKIHYFTYPFSLWLQFSSVTQLCPTLCDPMDCSTPGFPVHQQLLKLVPTHVHQISDAIQSSHPLSSPSSLASNLYYGLSQDIECSSLCCTLGPCCLSILYIVTCIC